MTKRSRTRKLRKQRLKDQKNNPLPVNLPARTQPTFGFNNVDKRS